MRINVEQLWCAPETHISYVGYSFYLKIFLNVNALGVIRFTFRKVSQLPYEDNM